ncbi:MAG: hypothetical protein NTW32_26860 [Chloroflexi bacterium]|nr:hypothetical protein [Chloroflexota bacterium]
MATKIFPDEEPENIGNEPQDHQAESNQPVPETLHSTPAFDNSDEDEFGKMRQAMIDNESNRTEHEKAEISDQPFGDDSAFEINIESNQSGEFKADFTDPKPLSNVGQHAHLDPILSPFNDDDFGLIPNPSPFSTDKQVTSSEQAPQAIDPSKSSTLWLQDNQPEINDDMSQRISSIRYDDEIESAPSLSTPPFVMEDIVDLSDDDNNSLSEKIRRGSVPAETLELLINKSMTETEVVAFAKKLGIDWNLTPGETREEKTEFLIYYFNNRANGQIDRDSTANSKPQFLSKKTEEDWRESDSRLQALQQTFDLPETPVVEKKASFFERLRTEFEQAGSAERWLTIGLSVLALILILGISFFLIMNKKAVPVPIQTPTAPASQEQPSPLNIEFPGGWTFDLTVGTVQDGVWNPSSPEWLQGTEICRLVSLPWNKQLDAVFQTFTAEDRILLTMSNNDILAYRVESTKILKSDEINQLLNRTSPCMVIVYSQHETDAHQVIIAVPDYASPSQSILEKAPTQPSLTTTP